MLPCDPHVPLFWFSLVLSGHLLWARHSAQCFGILYCLLSTMHTLRGCQLSCTEGKLRLGWIWPQVPDHVARKDWSLSCTPHPGSKGRSREPNPRPWISSHLMRSQTPMQFTVRQSETKWVLSCSCEPCVIRGHKRGRETKFNLETEESEKSYYAFYLFSFLNCLDTRWVPVE